MGARRHTRSTLLAPTTLCVKDMPSYCLRENHARPVTGCSRICSPSRCLFVAVLSPCASARAEITWVAPPLCLDEREFVARVERLGGEHLLASTTATIHVERSSAGFRARMRLRTPDGDWTRRFALCLSLSGVLPLLRSRFVFSDAGTLHRAAPLALHAWLGVEVRL